MPPWVELPPTGAYPPDHMNSPPKGDGWAFKDAMAWSIASILSTEASRSASVHERFAAMPQKALEETPHRPNQARREPKL
ncbi:hypothetical protein NDU88_003418 [Pleurodeles waltl]|uniref:Uncharacterized protein n=1 Tax=Pleurodeles waltl TaxID=8319 RepID=A0AAV7MTD8_PLEWA|nr:hypothetical protein NDU88_003418 [Pleurodeles waltl]